MCALIFFGCSTYFLPHGIVTGEQAMARINGNGQTYPGVIVDAQIGRFDTLLVI